jgi:hypothetical protein
VAPTNELARSKSAAAPASAPRRSEPAPAFPGGAMLSLQRAAGNKAVASLLEPPAPAAGKSPRLRTALDSKLVVSPDGDGYAASLQLTSQGQPVTVPVVSYRAKGDTPLEHLPVYLEDIVSGNQAVVNVRYDPAAADVTAAFETKEAHGVDINVRLLPGSGDALTVASAPGAHQVGADGMNVDGKEKVTQHSSASATDKIMGSIASAEGGFASVEGADAGVLTWGQGQWTVTAGELQDVLGFIKERRRDLFDRYWGVAGLDVDGKNFVHEGKKWGPAKKSMMALFRPDLPTITRWAEIFGQAGMDPQIQRLQREYLRGEVQDVLGKQMGGHSPESVLDTRGQAYYYSMEKNLPGAARANFLAALKSVDLKEGDAVRDEQKATISESIGELFRNSSVVAFDNTKHHVIGFWGEGGRTRGLDQADAAIAAGGDAKWSVSDWQKQRHRVEVRESRFAKTRADIEGAIAHQDVEPDIPDGVFSADPVPAVAGPAGPGLVGAVGEDIRHLVDDAGAVLALAATGLGISELQITGSVGRGGKNQPHDVAAVSARMLGSGYPPGATLSELGDAIALYQTEVVGMPTPDGRIDPAGHTVAALRSGRRADAPVAGAPAPAQAGPPPAAPAPPAPVAAPAVAARPAAPAPAPAAPATHPVAPVSAPPAVAAKPSGPRSKLSDSDLEKLVASSAEPAVHDAAAELAELEQAFAHLAHNERNEEIGEGRDRLVEGFRSLRTKVAKLDAALQPHFYRAINAISPYYFQGLNIILEFDRKDKKTGKLTHVWNTCNITSLAMCLEALGRSAADYRYQHLLPPIAKHFSNDVEHKARDKVGTDLAGLRLPDLIAMAAIVWQMKYKPGSDAEIDAAGNEAFQQIPSADAIATLARDFGVTASIGSLTLSESGKGDHTASKLDAYGKTHWKSADDQAVGEGGKAAAEARNAGKLTEGTIEHDVPLERYKQAALAQVGRKLDGGHEVVVGQWHHFIRLQALTDDAVIKDDPGHYTGANETATWEEARAMGLFLNWVVIG